MSQSTRQKAHFVKVTPTVDTSAYASGDQVGGSATEVKAGNDGRGGLRLVSLTVVDQAKQDSGFDLLFFDKEPTVAGSDNGAVDVDDGEMAKCVGVVSVTSSEYLDLADNSVATLEDINFGCSPDNDTGKLWVLPVVKDSPTYVAADDLTFKFYFQHDH